ncbi:hypothetical protein Q8F55_007316 [Vanrija albida]|uniref:Granulins domain-containing protein n=1 Tax=Vanrija albida TaxID=181172 RepID=A0ABR3PZF5_9TREE
MKLIPLAVLALTAAVHAAPADEGHEIRAVMDHHIRTVMDFVEKRGINPPCNVGESACCGGKFCADSKMRCPTGEMCDWIFPPTCPGVKGCKCWGGCPPKDYKCPTKCPGIYPPPTNGPI